MKLPFQCVRMLWNDASRLIATCSDYIDNSRHISCTSSNINCPRKEAAAHQHLMDHVCVQPEKAFVLSECPLQKKVADKALEKAKEGSKGTMEWAKEKMKKRYEATKVRAVEGLEAEKEEGREGYAENLMEEPQGRRNEDIQIERVFLLKQRESWWLCEEVQSKVTAKQARFRELLSCQEGNQKELLRAHERYKEAKKESKEAVA
ncbi:hypothetical protein Tco_0223517 [Tanacetum coccineum]